MKKIWLVFAIFFIAILFTSGNKSFKTIETKAKAQQKATKRIIQWEKAFKKLEHVKEEWPETFTDASSVSDLLGLYYSLGLEEIELSAKSEMLRLASLDRVKFDKIDIGLNKACLYTVGNKMEVNAQSFPRLLKGVYALLNRNDVIIDNVRIWETKGIPTATLTGFCVLFRDPKKNKLKTIKVPSLLNADSPQY